MRLLRCMQSHCCTALSQASAVPSAACQWAAHLAQVGHGAGPLSSCQRGHRKAILGQLYGRLQHLHVAPCMSTLLSVMRSSCGQAIDDPNDDPRQQACSIQHHSLRQGADMATLAVHGPPNIIKGLSPEQGAGVQTASPCPPTSQALLVRSQSARCESEAPTP